MCPDYEDAQLGGIGGHTVGTQVIRMAQETRASWWLEVAQALLGGQYDPGRQGKLSWPKCLGKARDWQVTPTSLACVLYWCWG